MKFFNKQITNNQTTTKTNTFSEPPLNSGSYQEKIALDVMETKLDSGINAEDNYDNDNPYQELNHYEQAKLIAQAWVGLWKHNIKEKAFIKVYPYFMQHLFFYGSVGLYIDALTKRYRVVSPLNPLYNCEGQLKDGEYECYDVVSTYLGMNYKGNDKLDSFLKIDKKIDGDKIIMFRYDVNNWGYWITWKKFVVNYFTSYHMHISAFPTTNKKLIIKTWKKNSTNPLARLFFKATPFINRIVNDSGKSDNLEVLEGQDKVSLTNQMEALDWQFQNMCYLLGLRTNINDKTERNINSEVQYSQSHFDAMENGWLMNINSCFDVFNERYQTNYQLEALSISNDTNRDNNEVDKGENDEN